MFCVFLFKAGGHDWMGFDLLSYNANHSWKGGGAQCHSFDVVKYVAISCRKKKGGSKKPDQSAAKYHCV